MGSKSKSAWTERAANGALQKAAFLFLAILLVLLLSHPEAIVKAAGLPDTYKRIKSSLALIAYEEGRNIVTGSSFCISSDDDDSFFLTNAHVVGTRKTVTVFPAAMAGRALEGRVIRVNARLDVAIVEVRTGNIQPLQLASDALLEGQSIAVAGYPHAQVELAIAGLGLMPSVHQGTVNAFPGNGAFIEFDAQIEHGNSGGPVFDPDTGIVYGVVTYKLGSDQTNLGISTAVLHPFLQNAKVAIDTARRDAAVAAQSEKPRSRRANEIFDTYIPLRDRDQFYDCGNGTTSTMSIRSYDNAGEYRVSQSYEGFGPSKTSASLQGHDADGDTVFLGVFDQTGKLTRLPAAVVGVPIRPASLDKPIMTLGTSVVRSWIGSSVLALKSGSYRVQLYSDNDQTAGTTFVAAYADHVGMVAVALFDKENKPIFSCELVSAQDL